MPGGLWVPGAVWEFQQNLRALPTTGVQVVQSSTEPTTWQWEYTIQPDDLPLVDTVGRGDVPPDMLYGCLVNFWFLNNRARRRPTTAALRCSRRRWERFSRAWQRAATCRTTTMSISLPLYTAWVLARRYARGSGVRQRTMWRYSADTCADGHAALSDVLLLVETLSLSPTSNVFGVLGVAGTTGWYINSFSVLSRSIFSSPNICSSLLLLPLSASWWGGMMDWLGGMGGSARQILIGRFLGAHCIR
jgi:hypothetical protein